MEPNRYGQDACHSQNYNSNYDEYHTECGREAYDVETRSLLSHHIHADPRIARLREIEMMMGPPEYQKRRTQSKERRGRVPFRRHYR